MSDLSIINNIEQGPPIALWLYKHYMCLLCVFCCFECSLLHKRLYETAERAHTGRYAPSSTITWTSQSVWITEVVSFNQTRFSLQGDRWGSFPLRLCSAVRDEALQKSSALSRTINTPSPAPQPCSLSAAVPPPIETAGIFSVTVSLCEICKGHTNTSVWQSFELLFDDE